MKKILYLKLPNGIEPFREWVKKLDSSSRSRIRVLIDRAAAGGSRKNSEIDMVIILLLLGGDKSTQERDVQQAKEYRRKYV